MIFVTGGTGFLGKTLVKTLLQQGYGVKLLARPTSNTSFFGDAPNLKIARGDVLNAPSVEEAIQGCDVVVHAAALFRFWGRVEAFGDTNIVGTHNVLQAAARRNVQRLIHISSIAVAGAPPAGTVITEATPPHPVDPYQQSKLGAEKVVQSYHQTFGLDTVILRLGALYGPWSRYAFNRLFFEEFLRGWRVQVEGGRHLTFPCFVADAAQAIASAITAGRSGEIYNICGPSVSHRALNETISRLAGKSNWRLNTPKWLMLALAQLMEWFSVLTKSEPYYPLNLKPYVFSDWVVDSQKAQNELGFTPTPLEEGVRQTLDWYRQIGVGG
ncbi:MAG: NAD-dependent epimerase/dehydratase family protein [Anaerolineae bacterium]